MKPFYLAYGFFSSLELASPENLARNALALCLMAAISGISLAFKESRSALRK
jgi:hypothetical protein